jgi:hypothetical protein
LGLPDAEKALSIHGEQLEAIVTRQEAHARLTLVEIPANFLKYVE